MSETKLPLIQSIDLLENFLSSMLITMSLELGLLHKISSLAVAPAVTSIITEARRQNCLSIWVPLHPPLRRATGRRRGRG